MQNGGTDPKERAGCQCIFQLMDEVDRYIPAPERDTDKPFLMPVEDVFSITGRGTVATGRVERGVVKVSDTVEIVGLQDKPRSTVVTGVEMFRKLLDQAEAGDNIGVLLRGIQRNEIERGQVLPPGSIHPHPLHGSGLRSDQGRGRPSYPVLQRLSSAVLLPHHRRDRQHRCRRALRWSCRATTWTWSAR